jgi:hypothetical protein
MAPGRLLSLPLFWLYGGQLGLTWGRSPKLMQQTVEHGPTILGVPECHPDTGTATIHGYALQRITAIMCSARLSAANLSRLPAVGFHQPFSRLIRLLSFT